MTIYVDELFQATPRTAQARTYGRQWCHCWTDGDPEELHAFACRLFSRISAPVVRSWYQNHATLPHYDLAGQRTRQRALDLGAVPMTTAERLARAREKARTGGYYDC